MQSKDREEIIDHIFNKSIKSIVATKGIDYAIEEDDVLSNFKVIANRLKTTIDKYDVWYVFFAKHLSSLENWLKERKVESEKLEARLLDLITYLLLLWCLLIEDNLAEDIRCRS